MPRATAAPEPKLVGALVAGLSVLRHLAASGTPLGVTHVARALALNNSTCFHLLRTLVHEGMVSFDEATKTYAIGLGAVELARGALDRASFVRLVQPELERIAARHSVTVVMWQRTPDDRLLLVHLAENPAAVRVQLSVGARMPLLLGASGRCFAAFGGLDRAEVRRRFGALRWGRAPTFASYWASVRQARELGYAVDTDHFAAGVTAVAAPVFDAAGEPTIALGAATFSAEADADRVRAVAADLAALAQRTTRAIGGGAGLGGLSSSPPSPPARPSARRRAGSGT
jgi:DNA-binding IclR family transcriptional regulator